MRAKSLQLCPTLWDPMDCNLPGSSVHEILWARILEWVVMPSSRGSSQPRNQMGLSCIAGGFFTSWATREAPTYECLIVRGFPYGYLRYNVSKTELVQNLYSKLNSIAYKVDKSMDSEDEFTESETFLDHLTSGWLWEYSWIYASILSV